MSYYAPGAWNVICQRCGFERKSFQVRKEWTGLIVCSDGCWEPRHPQDLVRGKKDRQAPPPGMINPEPDDVFLSPGDVTQDDL